jgi:hypothetical protein
LKSARTQPRIKVRTATLALVDGGGGRWRSAAAGGREGWREGGAERERERGWRIKASVFVKGLARRSGTVLGLCEAKQMIKKK